MLTNWLELGKRAVLALERIADALEARNMSERFPLQDGEGRHVPFVQAASFPIEAQETRTNGHTQVR